jgi:hypothetical protein
MVLESLTQILSTSVSYYAISLLLEKFQDGFGWGTLLIALWSPRQFPRQRPTARRCPEFQVYDWRIYYGELSPLARATTPYPPAKI